MISLAKEIRDQFGEWLPHQGAVFSGPIALDTETLLIDKGHPWATPGLVLAAAYDGRRGVFVTRPHIAAFLRAHRELTIILHNAPFDLAVLKAAGVEGVYDRVEENQVWDTELLHRLLVLGTEGHTTAAGSAGPSRRSNRSTFNTWPST